jgi:hypothetical protein
MGSHMPLRQRNWKLQWNCNCKECLPDHVEHLELVCAIHTEKTATQPPYHSQKTKQLHSQETELSRLLKSCIVQWLSSFWCVIFFLSRWHKRTMKPLTLLFVQLTEQHPDLYDNSHPEGQSGSGVGKNFAWLEGAGYFQIKTYNKISLQSVQMKAKKLYIMTLVAYKLSCEWVLILHNYQLHLTDNPTEMELLL